MDQTNRPDDHIVSFPEGSETSSKWNIFGNKMPRSEIVYFCQIFLVYIVVIVSIVNLSMQNGENELWIALLSSSIGYILPNPSLKVTSKP